MGKTENDKEFEAGVHNGQRGGFLADLIQGQFGDSYTPYGEGYKHGAEHRYGPEGRYHTWDNRGSNDPKNKEISITSSKKNVPSKENAPIDESSGSRGDGGYGWEDGRGSSDSRSRVTGLSGTRAGSILKTIGVLLFLSWLGLAFVYNIMRYSDNNINEKNLVSGLKWNVPWSPSLKPEESYDGSDALRDFDNPDRNIKTTIQVKEGLKSLAKLIRKNGGWCVTISDYAQVDDNIWAVGIYSNMGGGFICYSPDQGNTWFRQWYSEVEDGDIPFRIYFFDSEEGWSFTRHEILHTFNGGRIWSSSFGGSGWFLRQLHIIDRQNLVAENILGNRMIYTSDGGKNWKIYTEWKPEILRLEVKLENPNGTGLFVYNK